MKKSPPTKRPLLWASLLLTVILHLHVTPSLARNIFIPTPSTSDESSARQGRGGIGGDKEDPTSPTGTAPTASSDDTSSTTANMVESSSPSSITTDCINDEEWRYSQDATISCSFVHIVESQRINLCTVEEVYRNCPLSCGRCCEDDPNYQIKTVELNGTVTYRECSWLGTTFLSSPGWWCDRRVNGKKVREGCPKSCNFCQSYISLKPSAIPTTLPSIQPSLIPSLSKQPSVRPTDIPSDIPSLSPSIPPTEFPSIHPTDLPTLSPTDIPTDIPSHSPSMTPTQNPSESPTNVPTLSPTDIPSRGPSLSPSTSPTTPLPSTKPSLVPTSMPTNQPTAPTPSPSQIPSPSPTSKPSPSPSTSPTSTPTTKPTSKPSPSPSISPTITPTSKPTSKPSSSPTASPTSTPSETRPNLVMIITDEHNFRTLSCYQDYYTARFPADKVNVWGDQNSRLGTPNLDRLAEEGAMYTNYYTTAPLCTPSRATFMTGLYPAFTGASEQNHGVMDPSIKTWIQLLKEDKPDYVTSYLGKWHLDGELDPGWGDNGRPFGFDDNKYRFNRGHFKYVDEVNGEMMGYKIDAEGSFTPTELNEKFTTDYLMDRGIEFIEKAVENGDPFATIISIPDPHGPNDNRPYFRNLFKDRHFKIPNTAKYGMSFDPAAPGWNYFNLADVPLEEVDQYLANYENSNDWQVDMQQYFGMVKCIDTNIGKLLDKLDELGIDDDTIVVFTSDHGDLLFEHGKFNKGQPYETSAGIPFLLRYPRKVKQGKLIETAHSNVDFAPTILSLMGVDIDNIPSSDANFQGYDVTEELLSDEALSYDEDKIIISFDSGKTPIWAFAMKGPYKLVISKGDHPWLFDVKRDPQEIYNYVRSWLHDGVREELQDAIVTALFEYEIPLRTWGSNTFIDHPVCYDKRDILPITNGVLAFCSDIGGKVNAQKCERQSKVKNHCKWTCNACCEDTLNGRMIIAGELKTSCSEMSQYCDRAKVQRFCPQTCNVC